MKNIIRYTKTAAILIAVSVIVTACPWGNPMPDDESKKSLVIKRDCYILGYWNVYTRFPELSYFEKDGHITIDCRLIGSDDLMRLWFGWNECEYRYDSEIDSEFRELAKHYGDTDYKKFGNKIDVLACDGLILVDNAPTSFNKVITAIDITSDVVWDEKHEAGASLADCFEISYKSFAEYIDSGYAADKLQTVDEIIIKPLKELDADDLRLVNTVLPETPITLTATTPPTMEKRHNLSVVFTLDDGSTRESTIEVEFP